MQLCHNCAKDFDDDCIGIRHHLELVRGRIENLR